jgi:predicted transcriptional regulator
LVRYSTISIDELSWNRWHIGEAQSAVDKSSHCDHPISMNIVRRTLDIDTDARLREMADERGQDVAVILTEAVALLDSVVDIDGPDVAEDRRRLDAFKKTRAAVPLGEVKSWVASWGSSNELPRPAPRQSWDRHCEER